MGLWKRCARTGAAEQKGTSSQVSDGKISKHGRLHQELTNIHACIHRTTQPSCSSRQAIANTMSALAPSVRLFTPTPEARYVPSQQQKLKGIRRPVAARSE